MAQATSLSDSAQEALKLWQDGCQAHHNVFIAQVEKRYKAFDGVLEVASDADRWTSKLSPPFVNHIAETALAALTEGKLTFAVKARPRLYEPDEYQRLAMGAEAHEILHKAQMAEDRFQEKLRPFALQEAIAGLTVAKTYWRREKGKKKHLELQESPIPFVPAKLVEVEEEETLFDGPCTEVVDVRDFYWHEAATELQRSPVVAHRTWMHITELQAGEKQGRYQNVDQLVNKKGSDQADESQRELEKDARNRAKDMVEVLEIWWRKPDGIYVCTLGNRKVELKPTRPNPFWHGEYPFVTCATRPNLFSVTGKSLVERIADLQEQWWDVGNQATDNLRLATNFITAMDVSIIDDIDAYQFEPGARWPVSGPVDQSIKQLTPDPTSAQVALPHLGKLEQLMQNVAGGHPFTSTSEAGTIGADTATEAALATNIAQQATKMMREQLNFAYGRIGQHRTHLNQQFMREEIMVEQVGLDNEREMKEIGPLVLQGDYFFDVSPMQEELMRSQRQASANALMSMATQLMMPWTQLSSQGAATPFNWDEFARMWLEAYDDGDIERFFSEKPPMPVGNPGAPGGGQPGQQAQPSGHGNVTAQPDPSADPSNQASIAPNVALARAMSMSGGANNSSGNQ